MTASQHPWQVDPASPAPGHYGQAPDRSRPAFAVVDGLSFHPAGANQYRFAVGDRVDEILPADVLAGAVARGEVTYDEPEG